jgi:hypothetical protein
VDPEGIGTTRVTNGSQTLSTTPGDGTAIVSLNRRLTDIGTRFAATDHSTFRIALGLKGKLNDVSERYLTDLGYDMYYTNSRTTESQFQSGSISLSRYQNAILSQGGAARGAESVRPEHHCSGSQRGVDRVQLHHHRRAARHGEPDRQAAGTAGRPSRLLHRRRAPPCVQPLLAGCLFVLGRRVGLERGARRAGGIDRERGVRRGARAAAVGPAVRQEPEPERRLPAFRL